MPKRQVEFFIVDILLALESITRNYGMIESDEDLINDESAWAFTTRQLEIVGEAMNYMLKSDLPETLIKAHWRQVVDFRNVMIHEYFGISSARVFKIVKTEVPKLEEEIIELMQTYPHPVKILNAIHHAKIDLAKIKRQASL